ncbi:hypothetical protein GJ496_006941 [Pomphorhynchus laevis]|nr:hypothetical protein GJ496_006941 [Pomphorhynchus laevis]
MSTWAKRLNNQCFRRNSSYLCPSIINEILRKNEYIYEPKNVGPVKRIFVNQLAANNPCEDRSAATFFRRKPSSLASLYQTGEINEEIADEGYRTSMEKSNFLFSVIDGHAGYYCADYVVQQIHEYIAYALTNLNYNDEQFDFHRILPEQSNNNQFSFYTKPSDSWREYCQRNANIDSQSLLKKCFEHLDCNLINDANLAVTKLLESAGPSFSLLKKLQGTSKTREDLEQILAKNKPFIQAASSGACCCTVMINDNKLTVASAGDCFAVLGKVVKSKSSSSKLSANGNYETVETLNLTVPHNYWNTIERSRILSAHPNEDFALSSERLLACLLPFRAFGDLNFKLPLSLLNSKYRQLLGSSFILPNYISPPYLTSSPDTMCVELSHDTDRFILIASDGLSDMISGQAAASVIHQFLSIERALEPCRLVDHQNNPLKWSVLSKELDLRANALSKHHLIAASAQSFTNARDWQEENRTKPLSKNHNIYQRLNMDSSILTKSSEQYRQNILDELIDRNAATYLIRHALSGGYQNGVDYSMLEYLLSHSNPRMVRDDITVIIIQLNVDYLSTCSNNRINNNSDMDHISVPNHSNS